MHPLLEELTFQIDDMRIRLHRLIFSISSIAFLIIGFILYILFRNESLIMFSWLKALGLYDSIHHFRNSITYSLPSWIYGSLPYALWDLSLGLILIAIWAKRMSFYIKIFIALLVFLLGPVIELFQLTNIIRGTFDIVDLTCLVLANIAIILLLKIKF